MIRLFTSNSLQQNVAVPATDKQVHYLYHVMRRSVSDEILLFNGQDGEWIARIDELNKKKGIFVPISQTRAQTNEAGAVLAVALIKKDCFDFILQKATELGVKKIIPLITDRTVIHQLSLDRANLIVTEAAEQCERLTIPDIEKPQLLKAFLNTASPETLVYLSERGESTTTLNCDKNICFIIGPEGGWSPEELQLFEHKKISALNLGQLILRAETAAISILAAHRFNIFQKK